MTLAEIREKLRGFQRSFQQVTVRELQRPASKDRPRPGPGAPLTAERERYLRLVAQVMSNVDAGRDVAVHRITGTR